MNKILEDVLNAPNDAVCIERLAPGGEVGVNRWDS